MNDNWKKARLEQDKFFSKLQGDFQFIEWDKDAVEISFVPEGWERIVYDLFDSMNRYQSIERGKFEDTLLCKFKFACNRTIDKIRALVNNPFDPYKPFKPKDTDWYFFTPQLQEKIRETNRYKITVLINKIFRRLKFNMDEHYLTYFPPKVTIGQIKEKFGTLVIYVDGGDKQIDGMIFMAEHLSGKTCEITGNPGVLCVKKGWYKTLSKEKYKSMEYTPVIKSPGCPLWTDC